MEFVINMEIIMKKCNKMLIFIFIFLALNFIGCQKKDFSYEEVKNDVISGNIYKIRKYLNSDAFLENINNNKYNLASVKNVSILHLAVSSRNIEVAKMLIEAGANINNTDNSDGISSLNVAIGNYDIEMIKLLVEKNADFNSGKFGSVLLYIINIIGCESSYLTKEFGELNKEGQKLQKSLATSTQIIKFLMEKGADYNKKDPHDGSTLLHHLAYNCKNLDMIKFLIKKGVNINVEDNEGKTPLDYALLDKNEKAIELLKKHGAKCGGK